MATQPILQGYTLPYPEADDGYGETYGMRAVSLETANANLVFQRVTTTGKREFSLSWIAISNTELGTIRSAYDALLSTGGSSNFTAVSGSTYTVTPMPNNPPLVPKYREAPDGARWDVSMRLREVSSV
jgi:hypothetical protein